MEVRFRTEASRLVELIQERMDKYEEALWASVAYLKATDGRVDVHDWGVFATSLSLERRYPGINGIGVIEEVELSELQDFQAREREDRPKYRVHPSPLQGPVYPVVFLEPLAGNEKALGFNLAHEQNRLEALKKAKSTGQAQITGPIVLVQDEDKTPGFLFFAPLADDGQPFRIVSAVFVVKKLMEGTLRQEVRHVGLRIADQDTVLYDELTADSPEYDSDPLFQEDLTLDLYGRQWKFRIQTGHSFRRVTTNKQPLTILIGGLLIDVMLIVLFFSASRANRKALVYADTMNSQLHEANVELSHFAHAAAHELKEPLRATTGCLSLLERRSRDLLDDGGQELLKEAVEGSERLETLLCGIAELSELERVDTSFETVDLDEVVRGVKKNLQLLIDESQAQITVEPLGNLEGNASQLSLVFQNLIINAIRYRSPKRPPKIWIGKTTRGGTVLYWVKDNGMGIASEFVTKIFEPFQRLHTRSHSPGSGIGLALCKRVVDRYGGRIWVESKLGVGSSFFFSLDQEEASS